MTTYSWTSFDENDLRTQSSPARVRVRLSRLTEVLGEPVRDTCDKVTTYWSRIDDEGGYVWVWDYRGSGGDHEDAYYSVRTDSDATLLRLVRALGLDANLMSPGSWD